jgi:hypothetical protein
MLTRKVLMLRRLVSWLVTWRATRLATWLASSQASRMARQPVSLEHEHDFKLAFRKLTGTNASVGVARERSETALTNFPK